MAIEPAPPLERMERWMMGECWDFALALQEQVSGTLIGLHAVCGSVMHVGLQPFEGRYLDARGLLQADEFVEGFADDLRIGPVPLDAVLFRAGLAGQAPPWDSEEMDDARDAVDLFLERFPDNTLIPPKPASATPRKPQSR